MNSNALSQRTWAVVWSLAAGLAFASAALADTVESGVAGAGTDGAMASIQNRLVRIEYDLAHGIYSAIDRRDNTVALRDAHLRVNDLASNQPGWKHTAQVRDAAGPLGKGKTLAVTSRCEGKPALLLELTLLEDKGFVVLAGGLENGTAQDVRIKEICPLAGGLGFPADPQRLGARTLSGPGGAGDTRVTVGLNRHSINNLLLTYRTGPGADAPRRSVVIGGLTYREFVKFASVGGSAQQARRLDLQARVGPAGRLAAYVDCGTKDSDAPAAGPALRLTEGEPYVWGGADEVADAPLASIAFSYTQIAFQADRLDPAKTYVLGFSWWDWDNNQRTESVVAVGADQKRCVLLDKQPLPAWLDKHQPPQERAVVIPRSAYSSGKLTLLFAKEGGRTNAAVSEVWLWEGGAGLAVPAGLAAGRNITRIQAPDQTGGDVVLDLRAADPVGKLVPAGKSFLGEEKFYADFLTADPFAALEQYGLAVRSAQQACPNPYDFPTSCGWYVGLFEWGQAQNYPERSKYLAATTAGLVEEVRKAAECGFLKYSRAAVRIVPDKYTNMEPKGPTQQGWWDDEHWARYKHYTPPYETTAKYCAGVRQAGGLPFTYFQLIFEDAEFRQTHTDLLLARDAKRGLDYSNPATQAHMRKVYANLRAGGMAGMMFDYPDGCWGSQLARGGFADPCATAGGTYRTIFALAKEGLGPVSWIHERVLGDPNSDLTAGVVDSQRVWGDNSTITPEMVSRCGLRWYKNRVLFSYDMDAKNLLHGWKRPGFTCSETDGRRMLLTMAYVAASRMLLSTSYRDLSPQALRDTERTFPYHRAPQSARPVDMLVCKGWPKVYDFAVTPAWHQVTLFNNDDPAAPTELSAGLSDKPADGGLGLDPAREYYVYDFWNECFVGRLKGSARLAQTLRPGEARMLSVHQVEPNPQFLSTNRHIMQGYIDMPGRPVWNAQGHTLAGKSAVVAGETYKVIIACNGAKPASAVAKSGQAKEIKAKIEKLPGDADLAVLSIDCPQNAEIEWAVTFK